LPDQANVDHLENLKRQVAEASRNFPMHAHIVGNVKGCHSLEIAQLFWDGAIQVVVLKHEAPKTDKRSQLGWNWALEFIQSHYNVRQLRQLRQLRRKGPSNSVIEKAQHLNTFEVCNLAWERTCKTKISQVKIPDIANVVARHSCEITVVKIVEPVVTRRRFSG
jgi:hypothetical protein